MFRSLVYRLWHSRYWIIMGRRVVFAPNDGCFVEIQFPLLCRRTLKEVHNIANILGHF
jgi:hypothetical protein